MLDIARGLWKAGLPLKIKIFIRQMFQNRLLTAENVAKRNGPSDGSCVLCGNIEDANHTFFHCHLARFSWSAVRAAFQQNWNPSSSVDLLDIIHTQKGASARIVWHCVGVLLWSLWTVRNKMTIEKKFPSHPADILFKCHLFLHTWTPLGKPCDEERMIETMVRIRSIQMEARQVAAQD